MKIGSMRRYEGNIKKKKREKLKTKQKECKMKRRQKCARKTNRGGLSIKEEVREEEKTEKEVKGEKGK